MNLRWLVIRGSGIVAYGLLAMATIWGLLVSTKVLGAAVKAKGMTWFHESVGLASVLATAVHMYALTQDEYIHFGVKEVLVPGASTWSPMAVALGITAFYGIFLVASSFYIKQWIGQTVWRAIHYLSFGSFLSASVHGIIAGTDSGNRIMFAVYVAAAGAVMVLLAVRIAQVRSPVPREGRTRVLPRRPSVAVASTEAEVVPLMERSA